MRHFGLFTISAAILSFGLTLGAGPPPAKAGICNEVGLPKKCTTRRDIKKNAINSSRVKNGSLTGLDMRDGSLTGADIADGALTAAKLAPGVLTGGQLPITDCGTIGLPGSYVLTNDLPGIIGYANVYPWNKITFVRGAGMGIRVSRRPANGGYVVGSLRCRKLDMSGKHEVKKSP